MFYVSYLTFYDYPEIFCVLYLTFYDFQEIISTSIEKENYTVSRLCNFLYGPCKNSKKFYLIVEGLPSVHSNHI